MKRPRSPRSACSPRPRRLTPKCAWVLWTERGCYFTHEHPLAYGFNRQGGSRMAKVIQICASQNDLFALDDEAISTGMTSR